MWALRDWIPAATRPRTQATPLTCIRTGGSSGAQSTTTVRLRLPSDFIPPCGLCASPLSALFTIDVQWSLPLWSLPLRLEGQSTDRLTVLCVCGVYVSSESLSCSVLQQSWSAKRRPAAERDLPLLSSQLCCVPPLSAPSVPRSRGLSAARARRLRSSDRRRPLFPPPPLCV